MMNKGIKRRDYGVYIGDYWGNLSVFPVCEMSQIIVDGSQNFCCTTFHMGNLSVICEILQMVVKHL